MNRLKIINIIVLLFVAIFLQAQQKEVAIPFSNPGAEKTIEIQVFNAKVNLVGTDRSDVLLKYTVESRNDHDGHVKEVPEKAKGMKKIAGNNFNFEVEEKNNKIEIQAENIQSLLDLVIEVPRNINLEIVTQIGQEINVENINGDINLECNVGSITAKSISGNVSASATTGNIVVEFAEISAENNMLFNSITGDIELVIPSNHKATLKMQTEWGDVFTDHDLVMQVKEPKMEKTKKGKTMKLVSDNWTFATLNGGGPEITMKTKMGSIYLRK